MEAELAKIHVPLLYTRIFAIGHLLLSISNLATCKGKILRLSSRMEVSRRSGHVLLCTLPSLGRHSRLTHKIFLLSSVWSRLCGEGNSYVRIFAIGHLLLSISNLATYKGKILASRAVFAGRMKFMYFCVH